jgi:hypothetical protein
MDWQADTETLPSAQSDSQESEPQSRSFWSVIGSSRASTERSSLPLSTSHTTTLPSEAAQTSNPYQDDREKGMATTVDIAAGKGDGGMCVGSVTRRISLLPSLRSA